jgi:hypothetical protein
LQACCNLLNGEDIPAGMFRILRSTDTWKRWENLFNPPKESEYYLGYYPQSAIGIQANFDAQENEKKYFSFDKRSESEHLTDYNEAALRNILDIAQKNGIKVLIIKAPSTLATGYLKKMNRISDICMEYSCVTLVKDYNGYVAQIGLEKTDFVDERHLNMLGASKFTEYFTNELAEYLGIKADFSSVFAFKTESVESLGNGKCQYTIENYSNSLYRFTYTNNEGKKVQTNFSKNNVLVEEALYNIKNLMVEMIPITCSPDDIEQVDKYKISYKFIDWILWPVLVDIQQSGTKFTFTNDFTYPGKVYYAWYVCDEQTDKVIYKAGYSEKNYFSFTFPDSGGSYKLRAWVRNNYGVRTASYVAKVSWDSGSHMYKYENLSEQPYAGAVPLNKEQ